MTAVQAQSVPDDESSIWSTDSCGAVGADVLSGEAHLTARATPPADKRRNVPDHEQARLGPPRRLLARPKTVPTPSGYPHRNQSDRRLRR